MVEIHKHRDGLLTGTCLWSLFERIGGLFARVAAGGGPFVFSKTMSFKSLFSLLLLPIVIVLIKVATIYLERSKSKYFSYQKKDSLLTEAEKQFFTVLQQVVGECYLIFSQVSLLEILSPIAGPSSRLRYSAHNRIQAKHIDFLLCEKETTRPLVAIELDDSSHSRADRTARDDFLNDAFKSANLPLLRIRVASHYDSVTLQASINSVLDKVK